MSNLETLTSGGAFEITLTSTNSSAGSIVVSDGDVSDFSISGLAITQNAYATTWYDQSGSDNDAIQSTAASQPKVVDAGSLVTDANGNYALDFDGTDDTMASDTFTLAAQPKTIFVIGDFDASVSPQYWVDGSATNRGSIGEAASTGRWRIFAGTVSDYATLEIASNTTYLATAVFNGASSELFVDGTSKGVKNVGTGGLEKITIGSHADQAQAFLDGGVVTIIAYPSSASRAAIEQILSNTIQTALS